MECMCEINHSHLGVQQSNVFATKDFSDKGASRLEDMSDNGQRCQYELGLNKLIHVMETSNCSAKTCQSDATGEV